VRELRNVVERAVLLETSDVLTTEHLPGHLLVPSEPGVAEDSEDMKTLEEVSKQYIQEVLRKVGGNKTKAAEILGINRTSLWRIIRRLSLEAD
jgi:transcriptional regulator with PAS, ATPase and Fis domain